MKQSPQDKKLEQMLRSSKLAANGFLGSDARSFEEIIEADLADLARTGYTPILIADRMQYFTELGIPQLGIPLSHENWLIQVVDYPGKLVCPFPHPGQYVKRVTTLKKLEPPGEIFWSDLNIHLIREHAFFEGKGSFFRLEPILLARILF